MQESIKVQKPPVLLRENIIYDPLGRAKLCYAEQII